MHTRTRFLLAAALAASLVLAGCATQKPSPVTAPQEQPSDDASGGAAGLRLANGLYDLEGGTVQAVGILDYVDLEGGFWAITDGPAPAKESPKIHAVIANGADLGSKLDGLKGQTVSATGKRVEGASIRQAGPEIEVDNIEAISDTPGAAE